MIWQTDDVAAEWPLIPLSELTSKVGSGATPRGGRSSYPDHGTPLIRSQNVHFDGFTADGLAFLTDHQAKQLDGVKVEPGDVLLNITGASIGRVCVAPPEMDGARVNQHVCIIRAPGVEPGFLADYLASPQVQDAIAFGNYGATREALTKVQILELPVPVPPLIQQQLIAATLQAIEAKRRSSWAHLAATRRAIERFRQAVLAAACSGRLTADWRERHSGIESALDLATYARERRRVELGRRYVEPTANEHAFDIDLPESWTTATLGLLLASIKYGTSKRSEYNAEGVAVLRIPNVSDGRLDLSDLKFADLPDREARDLALVPGDVLMIRSNGSPQLVGRSVLVSADAEGMAYAGYLMRLRADRLVIDPAFLTAALTTPDIRHQIEMPLRSTSGVNNINTTEVRSLRVAVPPLEEQVEIVRRLDHLFRLADGLATRIDAASKRFDRSSQAVLAKAFRGELATTEGAGQ